MFATMTLGYFCGPQDDMSYKSYLSFKASKAAPLPLTAAEEELKQIKLSEVQTQTHTGGLRRTADFFLKRVSQQKCPRWGWHQAPRVKTGHRMSFPHLWLHLTETTAASFKLHKGRVDNIDEQDVGTGYSQTFLVKSTIFFFARYGFSCIKMEANRK